MEAENVDTLADFSATPMEANDAVITEDDDIPLSTKTLNITQPVEEENTYQPVDFSSTSMVTYNNENPSDLSASSLVTKKVEQPVNDLTSINSDTVPNKKELMNSLSNVVDYITDTVAEKVSLNVTSAQFGEKSQNGFDSVNAAAEIMAKSGGKRRKTRKFKLTRKNKTKKTKKA